MKSKAVALLILLLSFGAAFSQPKSDREVLGLKGAVRSVAIEQEVWREYWGKWTKMECQPQDTIIFNTQGQQIEIIHYLNGGLEDKVTFIYDDKGRLVERVNHWLGRESSGKTTYTYNAQGNLTEELVSNGIKVVYNYDSKGRKISSTSFDLAKNEGERFVPVDGKVIRYSYGDKDNLAEVSYFNSDGSKDAHFIFKAHRIVYVYNAEGRRIETAFYKPDGSLLEKWKHAYDDKGNMIEQAFYNSDGSLRSKFTNTYEFDSAGNWIKELRDAWTIKEGKLISKPAMITYRKLPISKLKDIATSNKLFDRSANSTAFIRETCVVDALCAPSQFQC